MAEKIVKDSQCLAKDLVNDCISRRAAINALDKRFDSIPMEQTTEILQLRKDLRELPSAQPETHDKRAEMHACDLIDRQPSYSCSHENDTISRRAAIDAARAELDGGTPYDIPGKIERLPSAQPGRKTGKWIHYEGYLTCSECRTEYDDDIMTHCCDDVPKFCPNCGADMREGGKK